VREKLNENPLVQVALLGVLALLVGFLLMTRMGGSDTATEPVANPVATDPATGAPLDTPGTAAGTSPSAAPTAPATPSGTGVTPSGSGTTPSDSGAATPSDPLGFTAGPGLPKPVVDAYDADKVVVLLIVSKDSIDDEKVKTIAERLRDRSDTELFVVDAKQISDYSRIAQGVDVQRTPALVVLRPKKLTHGGLPTATIEYGFRGPDSVEQAVDDALYKGPADLPYYP
jgi:hypothetical protein